MRSPGVPPCQVLEVPKPAPGTVPTLLDPHLGYPSPQCRGPGYEDSLPAASDLPPLHPGLSGAPTRTPFGARRRCPSSGEGPEAGLRGRSASGLPAWVDFLGQS